jgi:hypothetical protein
MTIREHAAIDQERFHAEVQGAGQPAVLRGLIADWPILAAANRSNGELAAYLKAIDSGGPARTMLAMPEVQGFYFYDAAMRGFNFETRDIGLSLLADKLLEIVEEPAPIGIYAGSLAAGGIAPAFARDNPMALLDDAIEPRLWIGNRSRVATHYDIANNIACVVAGRRRFTLFPPDQIANLYVGPLDYNMAGQPVSLVDPLAPDLTRFPRFAEAQRAAIVVDLEPGDALYLPAMWWHHVEAPGPFNLLVNYWWPGPGDGPAFESLVLALLGLRDRDPAEKAAWRSLFDHYIFGEDAAHATDHIPEHARGVHGPASDQRMAKILGFAMTRLSQR